MEGGRLNPRPDGGGPDLDIAGVLGGMLLDSGRRMAPRIRPFRGAAAPPVGERLAKPAR
jgi:hypothetical protein